MLNAESGMLQRSLNVAAMLVSGVCAETWCSATSSLSLIPLLIFPHRRNLSVIVGKNGVISPPLHHFGAPQRSPDRRAAWLSRSGARPLSGQTKPNSHHLTILATTARTGSPLPSTPPTQLRSNLRSNITSETIYHYGGIFCAIGDNVVGDTGHM